MSGLELLQKIKQLVENGATIVGPKPIAVPGLSNYPLSQYMLNNLAAEIWGDLDGVSRTRRSVGKGQVFWGMPLADVMKSVKISPDMAVNKPLDGELSWIHRKDGETDIYFLVNHSDQPQEYTVRFRVSGKEPELWHLDNGNMEAVSYEIKGDKTLLTIRLEERESVFVLFNKCINHFRHIRFTAFTNQQGIEFSHDI